MASMADRLRPVPPALTREADVLAALDRLGATPSSGNPDQAFLLPASGLLAMSIPESLGGADTSNLVVAEVVSRLVTWNAAAAERLLKHLVALELVRTSGSTEQRKAIYGRVVLGDVFELAAPGNGAALPRLVQSGLAFTLEPEGSGLTAGSADWQIVMASAAGSEPVAVILDHARMCPRDELAAPGLTVHPDYILSAGANAERLAHLMTAFLMAAAARGHGGESHRAGATDLALADEHELLDAMIHKAAAFIDSIQIDDPPIDLEHIGRLCRALDTARLRALGDHSPAMRS